MKYRPTLHCGLTKARRYDGEYGAARRRPFGNSSFSPIGTQLLLPSSCIEMDKPERDHRSMTRPQPVSIFSRGRMTGRASLLIVAVLGVLAAPGRSPAQDAGVSGIPPGPANARGLNGSVNDPSGIGNASRVPAIPPPAISPVAVPTVSPPAAYRTQPVQRAVKTKRMRYATSRSRRADKATVRERDRPRDGVPSICRGC
jgi:hypothetical protein